MRIYYIKKLFMKSYVPAISKEFYGVPGSVFIKSGDGDLE